MQTTNEYLDAVKAKTGAASDYALAKILNVTHSRISNYRTGYSKMDDYLALQVAQILEIEPFIVMASIHAERAKTEPEKNAWKAALEKFGGMAAAVVLGISVSAPTHSQAAPNQGSGGSNFPNDVYYVK